MNAAELETEITRVTPSLRSRVEVLFYVPALPLDAGNKLPTVAEYDADGTLLITVDMAGVELVATEPGRTMNDPDAEFEEMKAAAEDAEVRCVRAENALVASQVLITRLTAQVELAQLTITNLRGLVADLEGDLAQSRDALLQGSADDLGAVARMGDLEEAARHAGHLLRRVLRMHMDGYWVAPTSFMGEADVIVARIDHLVGRE